MNLICSAPKAGHQTSLSRRPQPRRELEGEANKSARRRTAALRPRAAGGCGMAQAGALRGSKRTGYKGQAGHLGFVIRASGQLAGVSQGLCVHGVVRTCGRNRAPYEQGCALSVCLPGQLFHSGKLFFKIWGVGGEKSPLLPLCFVTCARVYSM